MNLPNRLTLSRILLVPFILVFVLPIPSSFVRILDDAGGHAVAAALGRFAVFVSGPGLYVAAALFLVAALTDTLDGSIARRRGLVTNLGKFLDPIADKVLVASVLVALVAIGRVGALAVIVILLREFVVSALRMVASDKGVVIAASWLGKTKTVTQIVAIMAVLLEGVYPPVLVPAGQFLMLVAVALTIWSGIDYVVAHAGALRDSGASA